MDGIIKPDGPTQKFVKDDLAADKSAGNAFQDFWRNFNDMKTQNIIGADKYFHCKANYEASQRGWLGSKAAKVLSDTKELKDTYWTGHNDSADDQAANHHGRNAAMSGEYRSAQEACAYYRPKGMDENY